MLSHDLGYKIEAKFIRMPLPRSTSSQLIDERSQVLQIVSPNSLIQADGSNELIHCVSGSYHGNTINLNNSKQSIKLSQEDMNKLTS